MHCDYASLYYIHTFTDSVNGIIFFILNLHTLNLVIIYFVQIFSPSDWTLSLRHETNKNTELLQLTVLVLV